MSGTETGYGSNRHIAPRFGRPDRPASAPRYKRVLLSSYTHPTPCPVLTHGMVLRQYSSKRVRKVPNPPLRLAYSAWCIVLRACYAQSAGCYGTCSCAKCVGWRVRSEMRGPHASVASCVSFPCIAFPLSQRSFARPRSSDPSSTL
eukprot:930767-Rhodomonas_salina.1